MVLRSTDLPLDVLSQRDVNGGYFRTVVDFRTYFAGFGTTTSRKPII